MNVWFTSDHHFNHAAMVENGWRPQFSSLTEMNEEMISRWNEVVDRNDQVWHLGGWGLGNFLESLQFRRRLSGQIHLIPGNHDRGHPGHRDASKWQRAYIDAGFASVQAFARRRIAGQNVLLSHFPYTGDRREEGRFEQYRLQDQGLWLIHGHVHEVWKRRGKQINVGVDVHDFYPVSLDEIASIMEES